MQERVANELGNESAEIDVENACAKARSEAAGLSYTVFNPQTAGAAAVMAAAIMAGDNEPTEIEQDVTAIEEAALPDEVEKVARLPKPRSPGGSRSPPRHWSRSRPPDHAIFSSSVSGRAGCRASSWAWNLAARTTRFWISFRALSR